MTAGKLKEFIKYKKEIADMYPYIKNNSGIYAYFRRDVKKGTCCYIGQAQNIIDRLAGHMMGRKTHIDKSLLKHGLTYANNYDDKWWVSVLCYCDAEDLNRFEKSYIDWYANGGYYMYNVAGGGQGSERDKDVGKRVHTKLKSYKNGKDKGYNKAISEVRTLFDKYLDVSIKGKESKIKLKKLEEFKKLISEEQE